jgi:hypothetical protein
MMSGRNAAVTLYPVCCAMALTRIDKHLAVAVNYEVRGGRWGLKMVAKSCGTCRTSEAVARE